MAWYSDAQGFARDLGERYGVPEAVAAGVIAAISPNTYWEQNKRDAEKLIAAWKVSPAMAETVSIASYGANKRKALAILRSWAPDAYFDDQAEPKTWNFWMNLQGLDGVTVDRHAYSIAMGKRYTPETMPSLTPAKYQAVADAYRRVAAQVGVEPRQLQAVTWIAWHDESLRRKLASNGGVTN